MQSFVSKQMPSTSTQRVSGLNMPITWIKADAKKYGKCGQMTKLAGVALAAAGETVVTAITIDSLSRMKTGQESIDPYSLSRSIVESGEFTNIIGSDPVFVTGVKKPKAEKKAAEAEAPAVPAPVVPEVKEKKKKVVSSVEEKKEKKKKEVVQEEAPKKKRKAPKEEEEEAPAAPEERKTRAKKVKA